MQYEQFIKKFNFDLTFQAPKSLTNEDLVARPLTRNDLEDDMKAVNSSLKTIRKTRGGTWPSEAVTEEFDLLDLAWHEREFRDRDSYAYVVYNVKGAYIGCFYLYPMGVRTVLTESNHIYDIDVSWWVTKEAYDDGYYEKF